MQVNIYEAKAKLSALLESAQAGEEVIIARAGKPIARLTPLAPAAGNKSGVRFGGLDVSQLQPSADVHAPLTDDDLLGSCTVLSEFRPTSASHEPDTLPLP